MPEVGAPARVHPAARGFDTAASAYARARPDYPADALRALAERLGWGPGSVVLDLAAGTGKLTRSLRAALPVRLVAVEPLEGMRKAFLETTPEVPIFDGTAERIPFAEASLDGVVVGQAFHWFRGPEALGEIARVVRPGGGLGVVYNTWDERVPWVRRFGELLRELPGADVPNGRTERWKAAFDPPTAFDPLASATFPSLHRIAADGLVDRALSVSYVAQLPEAERAEVGRRVRAMARDDPELAGRATIDFPYVTEIHWTRRR